MAAPVENSPRINHHARRVHFAGDHALGLNLDTALGKNDSVEAAGDYDAVAFDLSFDLGTFSEDHGLLGNNISPDVAVDAEGSFELKGTFERHTLVNETSPLFAGAIS